jgi:stage V sporulation protein R
MSINNLKKRFEEIKNIAIDLGLDFFPINFEVVPKDIMDELIAYGGFPVRFNHWSFGQVYNRYKIYGNLGLSKVYELIINNNPSYAFLLDTNTEIENLLVCAHVYAHSDFFKNNKLFQKTNRNMINSMAQHAQRVEEYTQKYGINAVEHLIDIALGLDRHIDWNKGLYRKKYPERKVVEKDVYMDEFSDIYGDEKFSKEIVIENDKLPPHPEKDLLWFFSNYAPLDNWEREILDIIRSESYYFYPQANTTTMNEGWASYWHAEIINKYDKITPTELINFAKLHSSVINPGYSLEINRYYLGYKILIDIEKRFGQDKIFEVRAEDDDISFISNYLTIELAEELKLFTYGRSCNHDTNSPHTCSDCKKVKIKSKDLENIINSFNIPKYNYGVPKMKIREVNRQKELIVEQDPMGLVGLDYKYTEKMIEYIYFLWKRPVYIKTIDSNKKDIIFYYNGKEHKKRK